MQQLLKIMFLILFAWTAFSCKKMGCRDTNALNFEAGVEKSDGSCVYNSQLSIWLDAAQSTTLLANGDTTLYFYLNNELIGTLETTDYSNTLPVCGSGIALHKIMNLGKVDSKDYTLIIRNQLDDFMSLNSITLKGNQCLVWKIP